MEYTRLGGSGPLVSVIAHGLWVVGGKHWGGADDATSVLAIQHALDLGITLYDTAPVYGFGHSESVLGKALAGRSDEVVIASKCGLSWDSRGRIRHDNRPDTIAREIDDSLRRLGRPHIDLLQVHWPDPNVPIEDTIGALVTAREMGKIGHIGLSNVDSVLLRRARTVAPIVSVQMPFNILRRGETTALIPQCSSDEVGVLGYEPLCRGLFAAKFEPTSHFAKRDLRSRDPRFTGDAYRQRLALVEALKPLASRNGLTMAQLAVAFARSQPGMTSVLCGARTADQIAETAAVGATEWDEDLFDSVLGVVASMGLDHLDA